MVLLKTAEDIRTQKRELRFWEKVSWAESGCWEWTGARLKKGYGVIGVGRRGEGTMQAHRLSWEIHFGRIPDHKHVLHHCDNPSCVNPEHLFLGTNADNQKDMTQKGRRPWGQNHISAKLTEIQVRELRERVKNRKVTNVRAPKGSPDSQAAIAAEYGITDTTLRDILHNRTWVHLE